MATLKFDVKEVVALCADLDRLIKEGKSKWRRNYGAPDGPALWLVHDHGVYLMHNEHFEEDHKAKVVYANGCDPTKQEFDDWWEISRSLVGGDDFCYDFPMTQATLESLVKDGIKSFSIKLTKTTCSIVVR